MLTTASGRRTKHPQILTPNSAPWSRRPRHGGPSCRTSGDPGDPPARRCPIWAPSRRDGPEAVGPLSGDPPRKRSISGHVSNGKVRPESGTTASERAEASSLIMTLLSKAFRPLHQGLCGDSCRGHPSVLIHSLRDLAERSTSIAPRSPLCRRFIFVKGPDAGPARCSRFRAAMRDTGSSTRLASFRRAAR
jgi:hypothetical protein